MTDLVGLIMAHESGELGTEATLTLFSQLVKDGTAWTLQGAYGRQAHALIEDGYLTAAGDLADKAGDLIRFANGPGARMVS